MAIQSESVNASQEYENRIPLHAKLSNISPMWESLLAALKELHYNQPIDKLDINSLSEKQDKRAGFGSPTILVDGKDLFDSPFPDTFNPSCRYYPNGLPDASETVTKLKIIIR